MSQLPKTIAILAAAAAGGFLVGIRRGYEAREDLRHQNASIRGILNSRKEWHGTSSNPSHKL